MPDIGTEQGPDTLPPKGIWIRAKLRPNLRVPDVIAFTYDDPQAGRSAKGGPEGAADVSESTVMTIRFPGGCSSWKPLTSAEARALGLPSEPSWMNAVRAVARSVSGPVLDGSPIPSAIDIAFLAEATRQNAHPWRNDPDFAGLFHAEFPDDLPVAFAPEGTSDGEIMWVRVEGKVPDSDRYYGQLLNQPHRLRFAGKGDYVVFQKKPSEKYPWCVGKLVPRKK